MKVRTLLTKFPLPLFLFLFLLFDRYFYRSFFLRFLRLSQSAIIFS